MHEPSLCTVHTDVSGENGAARAWEKPLSKEGVEDINERRVPKMKQTKNPTVAESKPQVDNVVSSNRKMEAMVAGNIARTTEKMAAKEISALVAESLNEIVEGGNKTACIGSIPSFIAPLNRSY